MKSHNLGETSQTSNPAAETMRYEPERRDKDERVSLHPLSPEDALRALLRTPPVKD